jgi:outer membrane protein TolC
VIPQIPTLVTASSNQAPLVYESEVWTAGADLKGKTPFGTTLDLSINVSRNEHNYAGQNLAFTPDNIAFAGVSVDQPLLRDFGYDANLADVRINRKNKQIAKLTWQLKVIDAIQNVMATYYDMFYALENLRVKQEAVDASHKLVEANQRRLDLGLMAPIDLRQAQVGESIAQEELVTAKNIFMERQFALKRTVLKETNTSEERVFVPSERVKVVVPKLDRIAMMQEAFQNRLEYKSALHAAEVEDIRLRFARNQVLPKIDLVATYGLNGLAGGIGKSVDAAFSSQAPQWSFGVVATIPLGNVQSRAQLGIAKNLKEQAILRIKQTELAISIDVDTLISRIQSRQQSVETARQSRRLAEEAVTIDRRRLEEGQVSSFDVVETQKKLYDARAREIGAQAELDKSVVQLWVATGTLLQKKSITLGD